MGMFDNRGYNSQQNAFAQPWSNSQQYASYNVTQTNSNISLVMSLEEAIYKSNLRGSDNVHFNQNADEFYRVKVDQDGRKSWQTFTYCAPDQNMNAPATKADIQALSDRVLALENKGKEVLTNAESNG